MSGAVCDLCGQDMLAADGCTATHAVTIDGGTRVARLRCGESAEEAAFFGPDADGTCGDCGATEGHYHHAGCDIECCPVCDGQALTCGCVEPAQRTLGDLLDAYREILPYCLRDSHREQFARLVMEILDEAGLVKMHDRPCYYATEPKPGAPSTVV